MTNSIRNQLFLGLAAVSAISILLLTLLVGLHYGLFRSPAPPLDVALREIRDHVVLPVMIFILLSAVGTTIVVRNTTRRLQSAAQDARDAAVRGGALRTPPHSFPRELQPFAASVNDLTEQLAKIARRQEAFAADAAHELKTPLAVLALELDKLSEEDAARLRVQVQGLSTLVDQLLLLARSSAPMTDTHKAKPVDLARIAKRLVAELAPAAIREGREIAYEDHGAPTVPGLEEAIAAAARTLAVNALRVTPKGGEVVISAGPGAQICVRDGGAGLNAADLERLKARGIRADRAPGGDAGLGLAIADRIAEAHGAELQTCMPERAGIRLCFAPQTS